MFVSWHSMIITMSNTSAAFVHFLMFIQCVLITHCVTANPVASKTLDFHPFVWDPGIWGKLIWTTYKTYKLLHVIAGSLLKQHISKLLTHIFKLMLYIHMRHIRAAGVMKVLCCVAGLGPSHPDSPGKAAEPPLQAQWTDQPRAEAQGWCWEPLQVST